MPETIKLAEELIRFQTDHGTEIERAIDFVTGWLEGQQIEFEVITHEGLPVLVAHAGPDKYEQKEISDIIFHAHIDVVPGKPDQFEPVIAQGKLYGRGAYDMKGALAAMLAAVADLKEDSGGHRVQMVIVPDEERAKGKMRASQLLVERGYSAPFVICGEPTNLDVGVQAKGVLVLRIKSYGKSAHGSTPWLGENAILKSLWLYRRMNRLPFARERSSVFDGPSINLGHISGGDVLNKVPDSCVLGLDIRYLPTQSPDEIVRQVRGLALDGAEIDVIYQRPPAMTDPDLPYVRALLRAVKVESATSAISVGRDGSSDVIYFLEKGIPGVEFGPRGANHHGDDEHVEVQSLTEYRRILVHFVRNLEELGAEPGGKKWSTALARLRRLFRIGRRFS